MDVWLTAGQLRYRLGQQGVHLSEPQFKEFRRWGLVPEPTAETWPAGTLDRLLTAHDAGVPARALYRRVIFLWHPTAFPISVTQLRAAMVELVRNARGIPSAATKMRRLHSAMVSLAQQLAGAAPLRASKPPTVENWCEILRDAPLEIFESRVPAIYHQVRSVLPSYADWERAWAQATGSAADSVFDLKDIAIEERVTLLMVRDLAILRRGRDEYERIQRLTQQIEEAVRQKPT